MCSDTIFSKLVCFSSDRCHCFFNYSFFVGGPLFPFSRDMDFTKKIPASHCHAELLVLDKWKFSSPNPFLSIRKKKNKTEWDVFGCIVKAKCWLCWRPPKHCSRVSNAFSNRTVLFADCYLRQHLEKSIPAHGISILKAVCLFVCLFFWKVNCIWLSVTKEHPTAVGCQLFLEGQIWDRGVDRSGCFSQLSHGTAAVFVGWIPTFPTLRVCYSTSVHKCIVRDPVHSVCTFKDLARTMERAKTCYMWLANCRCAEFA